MSQIRAAVHTMRYVERRAVKDYVEGGCPKCVLGTILDITERKLAEQTVVEARRRAEEASLSKSRFLAVMSHELRTPLNAVIGFSELLVATADSARRDDWHQDYVQNVLTAGRHLLDLVDTMLDLSRIEARDGQLDESRNCLRTLVETALETVSEKAEGKGLHLSTEGFDRAIEIRGELGALLRALVNLLDNAIKFTAEGGSVCVRAEPDHNGGLLLSVRDTGVGIAPDVQRLIFDAFDQPDPYRPREHKGLGVGLAVAKRLVELHGGTLSVSSEPGAGAVFTIALPAERVEVRSDGHVASK